MAHFVLTYELAADYLERRAAFRDAHLQGAWQAAAAGDLMLGGAVGDPPESALLIFRGENASAAESFARADPYVTNGLVVSWKVRPWTTVVGEEAAMPARPA